MTDYKPALEWKTSAWLNTDKALSLKALRGRVIVLHAFQMLCPGCAVHALPQAQRVHEYFDAKDVAVVGLHTVFEHHEAMGPASLKAFLFEYRYTFPVGIDQAIAGESVPHTMAAYGMRGTPSLMLIDRAGNLRAQSFGRLDDLTLGAQIMALVAESGTTAAKDARPAVVAPGSCTDDACAT